VCIANSIKDTQFSSQMVYWAKDFAIV